MSKSITALPINSRVASMQPSATLAMTARASALRREGNPVVSLSAGEPDFDTPEYISEAGIRAIEEGFTHYTDNKGMPELREAIAEKLEADNGLTYSPNQILCSNGAKQSVALGVHVLCNPGDEVIIPAPHWVSYPEMVRFAGAEPKVVQTTVESGYRLSPDQLEEAITKDTRLLILCSPSNPTGSVYSKEQLQGLAEVLRRHEDVFVLSDEIYEHVIFEEEHHSIAGLDGLKDRTITVNGFSKAYAMTGWRLGYMAAPEPITKAAAKVQGQLTSAPSSISQKAGIAALDMDMEPVNKMVSAFKRRRDFAHDAMENLPGVQCPRPGGAFYLFPEISAYFGSTTPDGKSISSSEDLCFYLLESCHVALVFGEAFGTANGLRLSYATSMEKLEEGFERIRDGLDALS